MARTFRRPRQIQPIAELNVTNLIDLGFTLLIIFMIATPLINQEQTIPINLPAESKSPQAKVDKDMRFVAVGIQANGNYYIDGVLVSPQTLRARLRALGTEAKPPVIRIRADGKVPYEKIIQLIDELKKNNLFKTTFDTQAPG
jgi:biopolymer transport protein TolR